MSVPLDLSLISQLLNEQRTTGDLNNLTKPGFFFVVGPTNTPNNAPNSCHVINLSVYLDNVYDEQHLRIFQIYINDNRGDNTVWYRQYFEVWTDWERLVTATDLSNSMSTKVNNSDLVADYYNKTDVDELINTINTQLFYKPNYSVVTNRPVSARFYDATGTAHLESSDEATKFVVFSNDNLTKSVATRKASFTLKDDYPVNTKLAKIAFSNETFGNSGLIVPATITIIDDFNNAIVATLDTNNSDTEYFIYTVPTKLQNMTIGKGTEFKVCFIN